jgi:serine/threonine protein kinase/TolB-like protein
MLTPVQMAQMSQLLDEALDLDPEGRRRWLEVICPKYQDLALALRRALLPGSSADSKDLAMLPKIDEGGGDCEFERKLQRGELVGPYELISPLGAGGMAEVWLAQRADGTLKREVALKVPILSRLRGDLGSRFARERDILAALEHPNIARLYDAGVSADGLPYFAMEYVCGERLTDWCDSHRLGIRERLKLFQQVIDAVQYAHGHQVIHRDIKPSNILVSDSGQVRLLDFGVAKLLAQEDEQTEITQLYGRALTPEYASLELVRGDTVGAPADVYSLGMVLYELLCGNRPYRLNSRAPVGLLEQAIADARVERPSTQLGSQAAGVRGTTQKKLARQLKGDLDAIVLKALAKAPGDRYHSAEALAEDLRRYLSGEAVQARPDQFIYRLGKFALRRRALLGGAAVAAALVAAALGYGLMRQPGIERGMATTSGVPVLETSAVSAESKSIAVLPFIDLSEQKDQEYFSDGLSEELINHLAHSADLKVIARTSSFAFKGRNEDVRSIAAKLGVAHLLEGSVRKAGQGLRITVKLIRASDGAHLWSQTYDRDLVDIFKLQDEIAATVAQALHVTLERASRASGPEPDVRAYDLVLEGNYFKARQTRSDVERAIQLYRRAIDIRPDYALPWARLASAYLNQVALNGAPSEDENNKIVDALDRAIRLDPRLIWAYYTQGGYRMTVTWDWAGARADVERMREIDPGSLLLPRALGDIAKTFGQIDAAVQLYQRAAERNPLDSYSLDSVGFALCAANRLKECLQARLKLQQLHPEFGRINSAVSEARLFLGQSAEALEAIHKEPEKAWRLAGLAMVYWAMGRRDESDAAVKSLTQDTSPNDAYRLAQVRAFRGEIDAAFDCLDRAYRQHNAGMTDVKSDPLLRNLHADGRFQALLIKLKLADQETASIDDAPESLKSARANPGVMLASAQEVKLV